MARTRKATGQELIAYRAFVSPRQREMNALYYNEDGQYQPLNNELAVRRAELQKEIDAYRFENRIVLRPCGVRILL